MATHTRPMRRGLPRWRGGEPWPPAEDGPTAVAKRAADPIGAVASDGEIGEAAVVATVTAPIAAPVESDSASGGRRAIRRGLPRVRGGESRPPAGQVPMSATAATAEPAPNAGPASIRTTTPAGSKPAAPVGSAALASDRPLRRGLPRAKGGDQWPPSGFAPASATREITRAAARARVEPPRQVATRAAQPVAQPEVAASAAAPTSAVHVAQPRPTRAPMARQVAPPSPSAPDSTPAKGPGRFGAYSRGQVLTAALIGGSGLLLAAAIAVTGASWLLDSAAGRAFLAAFPGEYHLPESATPGFPAWVQWQHFFNAFLIVLIIRSGLQVRTEQKPSAYWTPRWSKNGEGKISLALWFHQSLDVLWLVNGVVFVVLLFTTGHWMRIVPTSWEVFPNAMSAGLQYLSLDWPTENGWANYNSLQQLMYFATVFIAAPLAAITGVRMSGLWPKSASTLNRVYPVEWARALHFPVMLYFVAFIIVHVALVFATGALRNLNHMYGGTDVVNWAGFWIFVASLVLIVGGWIAARPLVLAPIAQLSGKVSAR